MDKSFEILELDFSKYQPIPIYENNEPQYHNKDFKIIEIKVSKKNGLYVADDNGLEKVDVIMKSLTYEDNCEVDLVSEIDGNVSGILKRKNLLRRCLIDWNIDVSIDRKDGWIEKSCFEKIMTFSPSIINKIIDIYEEHYIISEEEEKIIDKQSAILFGTSGSVAEACYPIKLFCELGSFWDKFGLNVFQLRKLDYKDFLYLKTLLSKENDAKAKKVKSSKQSTNKVAGLGGGVRASRGVKTHR